MSGFRIFCGPFQFQRSYLWDLYQFILQPCHQCHCFECGSVVVQVCFHLLSHESCASLSQVLKLNGIPSLLGLLHSPNSRVHQTAAAALRNLAFKSDSNKEEINRSGGVTDIVTLLQNTDNAETQKQLTGTTRPEIQLGAHTLKCHSAPYL